MARQPWPIHMLATGPWACIKGFQKNLKPVYAHLRSHGIEISGYIDDSISVCDDYAGHELHMDYAVKFFDQLGFTVNTKTSVLPPLHSCTIEHLGSILDSQKMTVTFTDSKKQGIHDLAVKIMSKSSFPISDMAQFLGKLVARKWGGGGGGGGGLSYDGKFTANAQWTHEEALQHINYRELQGIFFVMTSFCNDKKNTHVRFRCDNTTAAACIYRMASTKPKLVALTRQIWMWAIARDITISAELLFGQLNKVADEQSRLKENLDAEWMMKPLIFRQLCNQL